MSFKNVISVSGGKDSTATLLVAIERGLDFRAVFADTGHEHQITYDYLDYLEAKLGIEIERFKADFTGKIEARKQKLKNHLLNLDAGKGIDRQLKQFTAPMIERIIENLNPTGIPLLDLAILKGRFSSSKAAFCTSDLKIEVIESQVLVPLYRKGHRMISWQGVRREESKRRSTLPITDHGEFNSLIYRPLIDWTWQQVFDQHKRHDIEPNPLYKRGMSRVGCMPCVQCSKSELAAIALEFPEVIDRVEKWEHRVSLASKLGKSTLFQVSEVPGWPKEPELIDITEHGIRGRVEYSKTSRGGRQKDLITESATPNMCVSAYGLC